jgi:hypothetical protein
MDLDRRQVVLTQRGCFPVVGSDVGLILPGCEGIFEQLLPFPYVSVFSVIICRKAAIVCIFRGGWLAAFEPSALILHHHTTEFGI